jgi:hypothetical protein
MPYLDAATPESAQFVQDHLHDAPERVLFKYQGKVSFDLKFAVQQISARQKVTKKLPSWTARPDLLFPPSINLEQSSSEETAAFKAKNESGQRMMDLTGGFGVDFYQLATGFAEGVYCEQQPELFALAQHNLSLLSPGKFTFHSGDGLAFLSEFTKPLDLIYADPARRGTGNQKLFKLRDCEPDVVSAWPLLKSKAQRILLKVSPMLDLAQAWAELPEVKQIQIVSVKNEVKEVLLRWNNQKSTDQKTVEVVELDSDLAPFSFEPSEEVGAESSYGEVGAYLVEPSAGILKAGAFKLFGARYGVNKLSQHSHLYSSDVLPEPLPGRIFEVIRELSPRKKELLEAFPEGKVNVICRNYSLSAAELKKKWGLKDGGTDYLIGTQTVRGYKLFWCKRRT